ncbi:MAG: hypothetical protein ACUVXJ_06775 [Phycisphaerae bacterium]
MDEPNNQILRFGLLLRIQKCNLIFFWVAILSVFGGFALAMLDFAVGSYVLEIGWILVAILLLNAWLVLPFVKCPRGGHRFFMPDGILGLLGRIKVSDRKCVHCGLTKE